MNGKGTVFFCDKPCKFDQLHPDRTDWLQVRTLPLQDKLISICQERKDKRSEEICKKLLNIHDLVAAEGRYHKKCKSNFYVGPLKSTETPGRPKNLTCIDNFNAVCEWLEGEAEIHTLSEVYKKMIEITGSEDYAYSQKWLKKNLKDKYAECIVFVQAEGNATKVCLRNMVNYLVTEEWYNQRMKDTEDEAERIVKTAAKLIMNEIRSSNFEHEFYPDKDSMGDVTFNIEWVPPYLKVFMKYLVKPPLKQASLGQGIVQATRPRSCVPPVLLGVGMRC